MARFLLIHGAWHGGWCWEPMLAPLRALGHQVASPDLPGMGADRTPLASITLQGWADFVADQTRQAGEKVFLVGHSRGGAVISQAAETAPHLFHGLVYVTALLLPDGGHVFQLAEHMPADVAAAVHPSADGMSSTLDPVAGAAALYNTTPPDLARWAMERLCPDPNAPNMAPLKLTQERYGALPRAYVECTQDRIVTLDVQRLMRVDLPCDPVITLDCDHSPFLSVPTALADGLDRIARTVIGAG